MSDLVGQQSSGLGSLEKLNGGDYSNWSQFFRDFWSAFWLQGGCTESESPYWPSFFCWQWFVFLWLDNLSLRCNDRAPQLTIASIGKMWRWLHKHSSIEPLSIFFEASLAATSNPTCEVNQESTIVLLDSSICGVTIGVTWQTPVHFCSAKPWWIGMKFKRKAGESIRDSWRGGLASHPSGLGAKKPLGPHEACSAWKRNSCPWHRLMRHGSEGFVKLFHLQDSELKSEKCSPQNLTTNDKQMTKNQLKFNEIQIFLLS